jgi:AcrR family transcriptional regulator
MAPQGVPSRRERLRAETTAEIKTVALALMASHGPDAITLRAIARAMGMTANAIYGYFRTRDDLVTALINDVSTALADDVETAWTATSAEAPAVRLRAWANAFRDWSLTNPQGFRLIFGDPIPGYETPPGGPAPEATRRICTGLIALADLVWPHVSHLHGGSSFEWSDFDPGLRAEAQHAFPDLPPAGVAHALQIRGRLHGLVSLEIYGHTSTQMLRPDKLYAEELAQLTSVLETQPASSQRARPRGRAG